MNEIWDDVVEKALGVRHHDRGAVGAPQRVHNYIVPDFVHVLAGGRIVRSGGKELALELEEKGYDWLLEEAVA